jgi:hypothetical protein
MKNVIFIRETLTQIADGLQSAIDCGCDIPDFTCEVEFTTRTYEHGDAKFTVPFRFRREKGKPDSVPANPLLKMPVRDCGFETAIKTHS